MRAKHKRIKKMVGLNRKGVALPEEPASKHMMIARTLLASLLLASMLILVAGSIIYLLIHGIAP